MLAACGTENGMKAMIRFASGALVGGVIGALMGYFGQCASGACPLTANPYRGAMIGALIGGLFALSSALAPRDSEPPPS